MDGHGGRWSTMFTMVNYNWQWFTMSYHVAFGRPHLTKVDHLDHVLLGLTMVDYSYIWLPLKVYSWNRLAIVESVGLFFILHPMIDYGRPLLTIIDYGWLWLTMGTYGWLWLMKVVHGWKWCEGMFVTYKFFLTIMWCWVMFITMQHGQC